tara:strand:+ start:347 stop:955 length:609 start_codon:yes stop_codon:yes gene_type:complete
MTDYIKGKFSPIVLVGMSRHNLLDEVDNEQIKKDATEQSANKLNFNAMDPSIEDVVLPKTPAINHLLKKIDDVIQSINPYLLMGDEAWTHLVEPEQSTMFHTHQDPGPPGLSFVYWVNFPKNSGDFVGIIQIDKYRHFHKVIPSEGDLIIFPTYLPHTTSRNCSEKTRISISGNYYPPLDKLNEVRNNPNKLFNYIGAISGR